MNGLNYAAYGVRMPSSDVGGAYIQGQQSRALEQRIGNQNKLAAATVQNAQTAQQEAARKEVMQKLGMLAGALYDVKSPEDYQRAEDNLVNLGVLTREDAAKYNYGMLPQIIGSVRDLEDRIQDDRDRQEFNETVRQFNLKFSQNQAGLAEERRQFDATQAAKGQESNAPDIDGEGKLRKEFQAISADFRTVRDAYSRIESSAQDPSAAGDLALIFNYMKVLDPGSVVRESEFATAANSAGVPDRVRALYNKVLSGERLADAQRADFLNRGRKLYEGRLKQYQKTEGEYTSLAEKYKFDPSRVVLDFEAPEGSAPTGEFDFSDMSEDDLIRRRKELSGE